MQKYPGTKKEVFTVTSLKLSGDKGYVALYSNRKIVVEGSEDKLATFSKGFKELHTMVRPTCGLEAVTAATGKLTMSDDSDTEEKPDKAGVKKTKDPRRKEM